MENPLKLVTDLFKKGGDSALGIDVGSSSIKVVQLKRQTGYAVLETYGELALGPYGGTDIGSPVKLSTNKMAEALIDIIREAKVTTKSCGIAIPIASSLVTMIELPLVDEKQLAQMVPLEARKYIPVPITEVAMDWWIIPKEESGISYPIESDTGQKEVKAGRMVDILLAVIHNDAITHFQDLIKNASLVSSFYEIEIFSTIRAIMSQETEPVMILDLGATTTKLYIVERGIVKGSHIINRGSQDITLALSRTLGMSISDAESFKRNTNLEERVSSHDVGSIASTTLSYIFSETNRVIINFEKKGGRRLSRVILTGGGALLGGLLPFAKQSLESDVTLADPFNKVKAPAFLENILKRAGPEFAVAIGIALRKLQESQ